MHNGAGSRVANNCVIVPLEGDLDLATTPRVRSRIHQELDDGWIRFVIDLTHCTFIDSTGFGMLIGGRRRAREAGGGLELVATDAALLRALRASELDKIFIAHPTVAAAIGHLDSGLVAEAGASEEHAS